MGGKRKTQLLIPWPISLHCQSPAGQPMKHQCRGTRESFLFFVWNWESFLQFGQNYLRFGVHFIPRHILWNLSTRQRGLPRHFSKLNSFTEAPSLLLLISASWNARLYCICSVGVHYLLRRTTGMWILWLHILHLRKECSGKTAQENMVGFLCYFGPAWLVKQNLFMVQVFLSPEYKMCIFNCIHLEVFAPDLSWHASLIL